MPKPALFAVGYTESDWIRYAIEDERGRYWTGRGFTKNERKALAYADENVIERDMRRILKRRCKELIRMAVPEPVSHCFHVTYAETRTNNLRVSLDAVS